MNESNMNNYATATTATTATKKVMVCPICGEHFTDVHQFAKHMNEHSAKEKAREEEENKKRLEDQKKYDKQKLEKLYTVYEKATEEYVNAKEAYDKKYGENYESRTIFDLLGELLDISKDNW